MQLRRGMGLAIAAAALFAAGAAMAQEKDKDKEAEGRTNPFVPPLSAAQEQARQDERMRNIVWQLQPEIKSMIMQDVTASQAALEIKMRRRIDTAVASAAPAAAAGGTPGILGGLAAAAAPAPKVPDGATFISCINGKALYRDKDSTLFQVAGDGVQGSDRCAK